MFLLVPAHPGFPGQIPQSRKTVVCVCVCVLWSIAASLTKMKTQSNSVITYQLVHAENVIG